MEKLLNVKGFFFFFGIDTFHLKEFGNQEK